jgi:cobalt/nickel transport system permease protein
MTLSFELPTPPDSVLRRFDPRWKLAALSMAIAAVVPLSHPLPTLAAFAGALLLTCLARLPLRWCWRRVQILLPLLAGLVLFLPLVLHDDGPAWHLWNVRLSLYGLLAALRVALKALTILSLALVLVGTTPLPDLFKAAHALRLPGFLVQLTALTYRYIFLVVEEFGRLRTALRVRGFRSRASLHSYRVVGHVTGTLLVRSAERAERVGQALRCRGFDGRFRSLAEFHTSWRDVLLFSVIMVTAASLVLWQLAV